LVVWKHGQELEELRRECEEKEQEKRRKLMIVLKNHAFFSFSCSRKFRITAHSPEITEQRLLLNQKFKRLEYLEFHAQDF